MFKFGLFHERDSNLRENKSFETVVSHNFDSFFQNIKFIALKWGKLSIIYIGKT